MSKRLNVILVPDEGGSPRRLSLSVFWLKFFAIILSIVIITIIIGAGTYSILAKKALEFSRLQAENSRLALENHRIIRVAREVDQSRKILAQIIRSLGGHLDIGRSIVNADSLTLSDALNETALNPELDYFLEGNAYAVDNVFGFGFPTQMPVQGFISQQFSEDHIFPDRSHRGIDIAGKTGSPILAAASGRTVFSGWTPYYGNCILIAHPDGYLTFYGHNQLNIRDVSVKVLKSEPIALLGTSGNSSAPHLHFEIWKDGIPVDPLEFVQMDLD